MAGSVLRGRFVRGVAVGLLVLGAGACRFHPTNTASPDAVAARTQINALLDEAEAADAIGDTEAAQAARDAAAELEAEHFLPSPPVGAGCRPPPAGGRHLSARRGTTHVITLRRLDVPKLIQPELLEQLRRVAPPGAVVHTLAWNRPNEIVSVEPEGIETFTERARAAGAPSFVPGWMLNLAWDELRRSGRLSQADLDPVVKRSSIVLALLARVDGIEVASSRPSVLHRSGD